MDTIRSEGDVDQVFRQARLAAVINAWANLGLFDELTARGPLTLDELPGDARALGITGRVLLHAGLLARQGACWALSPSGRKLHEEGVLGRGRTLGPFKDLGRLDEVLTRGLPVAALDGKEATSIGVDREDSAASRAFLRVLYRRSAASALETARWVHAALDAPGRVLDLGGGHGRYAAELAALGHRATLFDLPPCVEVARELHGEAIAYRGGDFFQDELGGPYEAIVASNIVHGLGEEENQRLVATAAAALAPGGVLVLKDMFLDDLGHWPPNAASFGLVMLLYTERGDSYSLSQAAAWLRAAGLEPLDAVVFEDFALLSGRRGPS